MGGRERGNEGGREREIRWEREKEGERGGRGREGKVTDVCFVVKFFLDCSIT